ncbi:MAG: ROK family protein [bacterium]
MYLLFDIGGTNIRLAISKDGKAFDKPKIFLTSKNFNDGIGLIKKEVLEISGGKKIKAVAGGIAGPLNKNKSKLAGSPNLPAWVGKPLKRALEDSFGASVIIENDAAVVGLGEAVFGAGKGKSIVAYVTVSTGIGGARIVDGRIDKSSNGFEPGHQIINFNGKAYLPYETAGDLESYVSGGALKNRYKKDPVDIEDKKIWNEINKNLAYGLHNIAVLWSPDVIVLGGGMIQNDNIKLDELRKNLKSTLNIFAKPPLIKKAALGSVGGLYGAIELLRQKL